MTTALADQTWSSDRNCERSTTEAAKQRVSSYAPYSGVNSIFNPSSWPDSSQRSFGSSYLPENPPPSEASHSSESSINLADSTRFVYSDSTPPSSTSLPSGYPTSHGMETRTAVIPSLEEDKDAPAPSTAVFALDRCQRIANTLDSCMQSRGQATDDLEAYFYSHGGDAGIRDETGWFDLADDALSQEGYTQTQEYRDIMSSTLNGYECPQELGSMLDTCEKMDAQHRRSVIELNAVKKSLDALNEQSLWTYDRFTNARAGFSAEDNITRYLWDRGYGERFGP
ncbi:uncharacterized protein I303_103611 [Kwoniella dejecticola CBS 10117]|uniref:Uncharacterized protein n=1 Tax=Kwoniella dejecticola CBS 10117 TaxID=1296121 RepID=A0A1A6A789_9TREE|nr:uncharacterized protein I303_03633 [Kwoniella dejecticola CBS 10117]OBR85918.1 hypothetical protein I303_03633 [Kwoniella dejecticola CBS 10117]